MMNPAEIKKLAIDLGADECGIAAIERFNAAPKGFNPKDIYKQCKSVVVFLKSMPSEIILADNPVPYIHAQNVIYCELDRIGLRLCAILENEGAHTVPVPSDIPYEYWDAERNHGMAILSMRHAAVMAGLGALGKNTLLINKRLGNMVYIGAVLINKEVHPDNLVHDAVCPAGCKACLDSCPVKALDGVTVNQALCRSYSNVKTGRGFDLISCNRCRKCCPKRLGY